MEIKLPDLGEGIESGDVVIIHVASGDTIEKNQTVIEIETDKAVIPIPSPTAGVVSKVYIKEGSKLGVGDPILSLSSQDVPTREDVKKNETPSREQTPEKPSPQKRAPPEYRFQSSAGFPPPASPTVRMLAQELGVDLRKVRGTERGGRIIASDVKNYVKDLLDKTDMPGVVSQAVDPKRTSCEDFAKWGPVKKIPLSKLRKTIGQKMLESSSTIPHVTQFDEADITELSALRKIHNPTFKKKGGQLTLTAFAIKVVLEALLKHPLFNASLDEAAGEIILKEYVNIGIAVDTEEGLIVPVLKDVDKKSLIDLTVELTTLSRRTKERKVALSDLRGGTFTISNLGSIGGSFFTPIINKPEVAILGFGAGTMKPVWRAGGVQQRMMLPVCVSYDHRVIDGANGARFIRKIVQGFEDFKEKGLGI